MNKPNITHTVMLEYKDKFNKQYDSVLTFGLAEGYKHLFMLYDEWTPMQNVIFSHEPTPEEILRVIEQRNSRYDIRIVNYDGWPVQTVAIYRFEDRIAALELW